MRSKQAIVVGVVAILFLGLTALLFIPKSGSGPAGQPSGTAVPAGDITNEQLSSLVSGGARLIDVRTAVEYEGGHIEGAENVPVDQVPEESASWDKSTPIVLYCQTGSRSLSAMEYLTAQGFETIYNLKAGVSAWSGSLVSGASDGSGEGAAADADIATGKPTFYAFMSDG